MKLFTQYLVERLSTVLYHATDLRGALAILSKDQFRLSQANETDVDTLHNKGKFFYMSFSRNKGSDFIKTRLQNYSTPLVNFEVDGDILSERYKSNPVGHFSDQQANPTDEFEDRLISDKHYIDNAQKYIKAINVFYHPSDKVKGSLEQIKDLAGKYGKPIYFYTDPQAFILGNKAKASGIDAGEGSVAQDEQSYTPEQLKSLQTANKDLTLLLSMSGKTRDQLSGAESKELSYLSSENERYQMATRLNDMLRTIRNDPRLDDVRIQLQSVMGKYKAKTMLDLITNIYKRFNNDM